MPVRYGGDAARSGNLPTKGGGGGGVKQERTTAARELRSASRPAPCPAATMTTAKIPSSTTSVSDSGRPRLDAFLTGTARAAQPRRRGRRLARIPGSAGIARSANRAPPGRVPKGRRDAGAPRQDRLAAGRGHTGSDHASESRDRPAPAPDVALRHRAFPAIGAAFAIPCGRGGTGRRAALRALWARARGSSSLLDRTTSRCASRHRRRTRRHGNERQPTATSGVDPPAPPAHHVPP